MSKVYMGFTRDQIETQARSCRHESNFLFLKNLDGTTSDICVKSAWDFDYGSLNNEFAWLKELQAHAATGGSAIYKLPRPIVLLSSGSRRVQFLVMESNHNVPTIREIMAKNGGLLDPTLATKIAVAISHLRESMGTLTTSSVVAPICTQEGKSWNIRGWLFGNNTCRAEAKTIHDLLEYIRKMSLASKNNVPAMQRLSWNHGDPSSRNFGYAHGVIYVWDFGRSVYGPSWIDGHALLVCDTPDYTSEMKTAFEKQGMGVRDGDLKLLEALRFWFTTSGFSFDLDLWRAGRPGPGQSSSGVGQALP